MLLHERRALVHLQLVELLHLLLLLLRGLHGHHPLQLHLVQRLLLCKVLALSLGTLLLLLKHLQQGLHFIYSGMQRRLPLPLVLLLLLTLHAQLLQRMVCTGRATPGTTITTSSSS